jgi:hypothetical protein
MCLWIKNVRAQGPRGITNPCFLEHSQGSCFTNTFKKNKNEKSFKKFFFFCLFECVFDLRTIIQGSRTSRNHESLFPQALSGSSCFTNTFKKTKTKKVLKNFFLSFLNVFVNQERQGSRTSRNHEPLFPRALSGFMFHKHIQKKQKRKKF